MTKENKKRIKLGVINNYSIVSRQSINKSTCHEKRQYFRKPISSEPLVFFIIRFQFGMEYFRGSPRTPNKINRKANKINRNKRAFGPRAIVLWRDNWLANCGFRSSFISDSFSRTRLTRHKFYWLCAARIVWGSASWICSFQIYDLLPSIISFINKILVWFSLPSVD